MQAQQAEQRCYLAIQVIRVQRHAGATGGTALLSGNISYTSTETAVGVYTYYAEARNTTTNCVSSTRLAVTDTIKASPTLTLTSATCAADLQTYDIVFVSDGTVSSGRQCRQ